MRLRRVVVSVITFVLLNAAMPALAAPPTKKPEVGGAVAEQTVPPEAEKLIDEAIAKGQARKYAEAVDLLQQAVTIIEKKLGKDHYLLGNALNLITQLETLLGRLDDAEKHADRSIAVLKKDVNADPLRLGHALVHRAELYGRRGKSDEEIELRKLALTLFEKAFGAESIDAMAEVLGLARAYYRWGRYAESKMYFDRWLTVVEPKVGKNDPGLVDILLEIAVLEAEAGHYAEAEQVLLRALDIRRANGKIRDDDIEDILLSLGEVKYQRGEFIAAEAIFERVRVVFESDPSTHVVELGTLLGNIGSLHIDRGDMNGGLPLLRRSLELLEGHYGSDQAEIVSALTNLGEALLRMKNYDECRPYLERALAIREKKLGPNHPRLAIALVNMGSIFLEQDDYVHAEPYFLRALAIQEKALGPTNPWLFATLQDLGMVEQSKKDLAAAEKYHQRAVEVVEKAFGPKHPNIIAPLRSLSSIQRMRGNVVESRKLLERAGEIGERTTTTMLGGGSEAQKLAWLSTLEPLWEQTVDQYFQFEPKNVDAARLALDATLRRKGRALDAVAGSLSLLRRHMSPDVQALFEQLREKQKKLAAMTMQGGADKDVAQWATDLLALEKEVAELEGTLSSKSAAYRIETQPATTAGVQSVLPEDAMYVEIVRRRLANVGYFPKGTTEQYVAFVLGASGNTQAIDLGDAEPIDNAVFKLREALSDPSRKDAKSLSRALDEKVMRPIRAALLSSKRLILSPDATLNFIPFEALVDEQGNFLIQRWSISYVTSGRDVFRWSQHAQSRSGPVILANPSFGEIVKRSSSTDTNASRGIDATGISRLGFTPLSGTAQEGAAISKELRGAKLVEGNDANKQVISALIGPKVLHIATHGFFLGDTAEAAIANSRGFTLEADVPPPVQTIEQAKPPTKPSPLLRSGLALTGANARGTARSQGILTALEASSLDLEGTKLVVLSACETGLGQAHSGEGVEGLRRAFVLAGAETTVMSLWKVDDDATRDMMIGYYKRLEGGEGRSEALRQVRLGMLSKDSTAHPFYWASFIVAGDPSRFDGTMPSVPAVTPGARGCACAFVGDVVHDEPGQIGWIFATACVIGVWRRRRLS